MSMPLRLAGLALGLVVGLGHAATDIWEGSGPLANGAGNRVVRALAVGPDGQMAYAGTGSGTVFRYVHSDAVPSAFGFAAQTGVVPGTQVISDAITVGGINVAAPVAIAACTGATCAYSVNGGTWLDTAGTVQNGDSVRVRQTASASHATQTTLTLSIGGIDGSFDVTTAPALVPVPGTCGGAAGEATLLAPTSGLCGSGTAGAMSSAAGVHRWDCAGANGGASIQCQAPGASRNGGGSVTLALSGGGCAVDHAQLVAPPQGGAPGVTLPFGAIDFALSGCAPGASVQVEASFSDPVDGMTYWKYLDGDWVPVPALLAGHLARFTLQDDGPYDADPAPGRIADPGGPGLVGASAVDPTAVPLLSPWGLALLALLLGLLGMKRHRVAGG